MKCRDCTHRLVLHDAAGREARICGQPASAKAGKLLGPDEDGCTWRDQEDSLRPLYHIARGQDIEAIRKTGLLPAIGKRSAEAGEADPAVYFFKTPEDAENAMLNWLGDDIPDGEPMYMLTALLPGSYAKALRDTAPYEIACAIAVPPDYLDFQDLDEWYEWYRKGGVDAGVPAVR